MMAERLTHHFMPVTTVDNLRHLVEAASAAVAEHAIQSLYDSILNCLRYINAEGSDCSRHKFLGIYASIFF